MSKLGNPVAIVSGASRGIGKAIALKLIAKGYTVIGLYKRSDDKASKMIESGVDMRKADVGSEEDVLNVLKYIAATYGRIDVLVNNAGIDLFGAIDEYPVDKWNDMVATNLTSVFLLSKASIPLLKRSSNPNIINISSRLGIEQYAEPEFIVYGVVKAGVNLFTTALAKELSNTGIRVNAIIPTPTKTDLFDEVFTPEDEQALRAKGKIGTPNDVATLVANAIDDRSKNGQLIFDERVNL